MKTVSVHEAKTHLSRLIREVQEGEEVVIARGGEPMVKLVLIEPPAEQRTLGTARGELEMAADFDEPLEELAGYR